MKKLVIFGAQSIAQELYYCLKYFSEYEVAGFVVDRGYIEENNLFGLPVITFDTIKSIFPPTHFKMFVAVGYIRNNKLRAEKYLSAKEMGYEMINFVSPKSSTYPELEIGDNCFIGHNVNISFGSVIGNNVFIGNGCNISHNVTISDHCFLSHDVVISGFVNIGPYSFLGANSTIKNKISIGNECVIGAGAFITESTADMSVYFGEPSLILPISSDKLPLS